MQINLKKIIPDKLDNGYTGSKIALYAFYFLTAVTIARSLVHIFALDGGAESIATIPLDQFGFDASNAVVFLFGLWGISQLIIGLIYLLAAIRYRSLIPLMYCLMIIEYIARAVLGYMKPIMTTATAPGGIMNVPVAVLAFLFLVLSLRQNSKDFNNKNE